MVQPIQFPVISPLNPTAFVRSFPGLLWAKRSGRYIAVSGSEQCLGIPASQVIGLTPTELHGTEIGEHIAALDESAIAHGTTGMYRILLRTPEGVRPFAGFEYSGADGTIYGGALPI